MIDWLRGWAATLHIMIFERDTYRFLRDYVEVRPPCEFCHGELCLECDPETGWK